MNMFQIAYYLFFGYLAGFFFPAVYKTPDLVTFALAGCEIFGYVFGGISYAGNQGVFYVFLLVFKRIQYRYDKEVDGDAQYRKTDHESSYHIFIRSRKSKKGEEQQSQAQ